MNCCRHVAAGLLALLLLVGMAQAHRGSESQLALALQDGHITGTWQIGLHDLMAADLMATAPPATAPPATAPISTHQPDPAPETLSAAQAWLGAHPTLAAHLLATLQLRGDDQPCSRQVTSQALQQLATGLVLQLQLAGQCPTSPQQLTVDYRLLMATDPRHQGLLRLQVGDRVRPAVFTANSPTQVFALHAPGRWLRLVADVRSGIWHIWTGFDHLLFLLCLLLPAVLVGSATTGLRAGGDTGAAGWRPVLLDVLKVVTAFTLAHSITLSAAALHWASLPARFTEVMIAASVVLAAGLNLLAATAAQRWQAAFGFGLVHGFGLASAIDDLGVPAGGLLPTLLAFNVGVEAGQLAVVAALLPLAYAVRQRAWYRPVVLRGGSVLVGVVALLWLVERAFGLAFMPVH